MTKCRVAREIDTTTEFLTSLQSKIKGIDQTPKELVKLPVEKRLEISNERRKIVLALCEKARM